MSETTPRPWLEVGAPEGVRALLESAHLDEPTAAQLASLQAKLLPFFPPAGGGAGGEGGSTSGGEGGAASQAGGATASASGAVATTTAATTTAITGGLLKTVLVAAVSSAIVGGATFQAGRVYERDTTPPPIAAQHVEPVAVAPPVVEPDPLALPAEPEPRLPPSSPPMKRVLKPKAPPAVPAPTHLSGAPSNEEVALLQQAMDALREGRAAEALKLLDTYPARFPSGVLRQEAEVLSIEALVKQDQLDTAQTRAQAFRNRWPTSTHLIRLDSLLRAK